MAAQSGVPANRLRDWADSRKALKSFGGPSKTELEELLLQQPCII